MQRKVIAVSFGQAFVAAVGDILGVKPVDRALKPTLNTSLNTGTSVFSPTPPLGVAHVASMQTISGSHQKQGGKAGPELVNTRIQQSLKKLQAAMAWQMLLRLIVEMREINRATTSKDDKKIAKVKSFLVKLGKNAWARVSTFYNASKEAIGRRITPVSEPEADALPAYP